MRLKVLVFCFLFWTGCSSTNLPPHDLTVEELPSQRSYQTTTVSHQGIEYKQILSGKTGKLGGQLVLSLGGTPKTFNYWAATDSVSAAVAGLMFSGLLERDPFTGQIKPHLAKSYRIAKGGLQVIIDLRRNIKWSDGQPLTSEDVLFTWNTIIKQGFERLGTREAVMVDRQFPEIKAQGKYTVSFETKRVFAPLLSSLSYPIAPAHFFKPILAQSNKLTEQKKIFSTLWGTKLDPKQLVVSGAFKLNEYVPGERLNYLRNPYYFVLDRQRQKLPYLKKLT